MPRNIDRMPFGKHKGIRFENIPVKYLDWMIDQDISADLKAAITNHLQSERKSEWEALEEDR